MTERVIVERGFQCRPHLKSAVEAVMSDSRYVNRPLAALLQGTAFLYGAAMRSRARLFARGRLAVHRLPCKVVSVGNITLGGTGKTPVSLYVAKLIHDAGFRVAVVSRGYRGQAERRGGVVSDGDRLRMNSAAAGDEPFLMARHLLPLGIPVLVGGDRVRSGRLALERFHTEVLVLDDGFQHMRLHRDLDLVLLDAGKPFGNGYLLPRGTLREPMSALARADACLLTRCPQGLVRNAPKNDDRIKVRSFFHDAQRPVFPASHAPLAVEWIAGGQNDLPQEMPLLEDLRRHPVFAFSGIARNDDFRAGLQRMGFNLKGWAAFEDHHTYSRVDLVTLETLAERKGATLMVTTEKDRVKIDASWIQRIPLLAVGVQIDLGAYAGAFEQFMIRKLTAGIQTVGA